MKQLKLFPLPRIKMKYHNTSTYIPPNSPPWSNDESTRMEISMYVFTHEGGDELCYII